MAALRPLLLALTLCLMPAAAAAATVVESSGEGEVSVRPDQARLSLGVTTEAATAKEAMDANARTMTAVVAALATAGFAGPDVVATRAVSLTPVMDHRPQQEPRIVGYRANNTVQVTTRDPAAIGRALDAGVQAGANVAGGIAFTVADPRPAETQALRLAVQDAQHRATAMAEALGRRLGRVLEVRTLDVERPTPRFETMAARGAVASTPVEPGLITVRARVTLKAEVR
ncbi:MAG: SIMPL domain-containing protein [Candidatus Rokubacteria bacterium]|nr:SIMPL domain-containing protein [Candidatus Rokubacteria bacterium]